MTGGHGFIGRHVVTALAESGATPVPISQHESAAVATLPGRSITVDLEDRQGIIDAVTGADLVIHLAARAGGIQFQQGGGEEVFASNRLITDNLLAACAASACQADLPRLIPGHLSARCRAAHRISSPTRTATIRPDPYAWSKITDEVVASWHPGLDTVVGRFGNVYGPGAPFRPGEVDCGPCLDRPRCHASKMARSLVVWGDGSAIRSFVFVEDVAEAVLVALTKGESGEAYNIDGGAEVTIAELATTIRDTVNPSLHLVFDASKPAGPPYRVASIDKLKTLGYSPSVDLAEGLRRTVEWYREAASASP